MPYQIQKKKEREGINGVLLEKTTLLNLVITLRSWLKKLVI